MKKWMCICAAAVLAVSALTGCSTSAGAATTAAQTEAATTDAAKAETEKKETAKTAYPSLIDLFQAWLYNIFYKTRLEDNNNVLYLRKMQIYI